MAQTSLSEKPIPPGSGANEYLTTVMNPAVLDMVLLIW